MEELFKKVAIMKDNVQNDMEMYDENGTNDYADHMYDEGYINALNWALNIIRVELYEEVLNEVIRDLRGFLNGIEEV